MNRPLPRTIVAAIDASRILGIRAGAGSDHRFTGVWPIVVRGRVFVRSWTQKPGGWYRTLLDDPKATLQVGTRRVPVRAVSARAVALLAAIEEAYALKYPTRGSQKYVRGFRTKRRRAGTIEFVSRTAGRRSR
ncbi:MAG TPA: DUF2255 family protein [Vicinamibacterales bacterium]